MKIFITGGTGFIGSHLTDLLVKDNNEIASFDASLSFIDNPKYHKRCLTIRKKYIKNQPQKVYIGDIRNKEKLHKALKDFKPEVIVHLAGLPMARVADKYKPEMSQINMQGTLNVLDEFEKSDARKIIYTSSSMAYGHFKQFPQSESYLLEPTNEYGACKAAGEYFVKLSEKEWVIIRPTSVYGFTDCANRVTQLLMDRASAKKPAWVIKGETLDFSYVKDTAMGFFKAIKSKRANKLTFNISRGESRSTEELANIYKSYYPKFEFEVKEPDKVQVWRGPLDNTRANAVLGYEARYGLEKGIEETLEYVKEFNFYKGLI